MDSPPLSSRFTVARWIFARALGVIFFCAFTSLAVQIRGLAGAHGIVPAAEFLNQAWNEHGANAVLQAPTLCWLSASDTMLVALCWTGVILSLVMICGVMPGLCSLLLWALYLSLCWVAIPFTQFQWDSLLLETALPAAVLLPWRIRPRWNEWQPAPHGVLAVLKWLPHEGARFLVRIFSVGQQAALWVLWWLLFRLMFESGAVKLASEDRTWWGLTALNYHFETQPLPLWTAWYASQLPESILNLAVLIMFFIELASPVIALAAIIIESINPRLTWARHWRHGAAWSLIALQIIILSTGNYAFFNLLTIALCLLLFDDEGWSGRLRRFLPAAAPVFQTWTPLACATIFPGLALVFLLTLEPLLAPLGFNRGLLVGLFKLNEPVAPFMSFNGYGLFRVMTTERHEITVEGSDDGKTWKAYEFRWKPGDLNERPKLVAPHQPRLDWQMWFAALGRVQENPWFVQFLVRLLEGSPDVLNLLRSNPFPDHPPRYVRAAVSNYHFTRFGDGHPGWWKSEPLGLYCPPITLRDDGKPMLAHLSD